MSQFAHFYFGNPWVFLGLLPLFYLLYRLFSHQKLPTKSPWVFLFSNSKKQPATKLGFEVLWWPLLFAILSFALLAGVLSKPKPQETLHIYLDRPELLKGISEDLLKPWLKQVEKTLRSYETKSYQLHHGFTNISFSKPDEFKTHLAEVIAKKISLDLRPLPPTLKTPALLLGTQPSERLEIDFIPYPLFTDSIAIRSIRRIQPGRFLVDIFCKKPDSTQPLKLWVNGETVLLKKKPQSEALHAILDLKKQDNQIRLLPLDDTPGSNSFSWRQNLLEEIPYESKFKLSAGFLEALSQIQVDKGSAKLLITHRPEDVSSHKGPVWLIDPEKGLPPLYSLFPCPVDAPFQINSTKALPLSTRHLLFDQKIKQLPRHHVMAPDSDILILHMNRPLFSLTRKAPPLLISGIDFSKLSFPSLIAEKDFYFLLLASSAYPQLGHSETIMRYEIPQPSMTRVKDRLSQKSGLPQAIPAILLMLTLLPIAASLKTLKKARNKG